MSAAWAVWALKMELLRQVFPRCIFTSSPPQFPSRQSREERSAGLEHLGRDLPSADKAEGLSQRSYSRLMPKVPSVIQAACKMLPSNQPVRPYSALPKPNGTALSERHRNTLCYVMYWEQCSWSWPRRTSRPQRYLSCRTWTLNNHTTAEPTGHACVDQSAPMSTERTFAALSEVSPTSEFTEEPVGAQRTPPPIVSSSGLMLWPMLLAKPS